MCTVSSNCRRMRLRLCELAHHWDIVFGGHFEIQLPKFRAEGLFSDTHSNDCELISAVDDEQQRERIQKYLQFKDNIKN